MTEQITDSFEVSPQQEQLWLAQPEGPSGRIQATFAISGPGDADAVHAALLRTTQRHEILRTVFVRRPGIRVPLQTVAEDLAPAWRSEDLSGRSGEERDAALAALGGEELAAAFDFERGPLVRALLVRLGEGQHVLVLTVSSLCADPASLGLIGQELFAGLGGPAELVEEPLQYADFAAWQRELQEGQDEEAVRAREFWATAAGAPAPALPFAAPAPSSTATATHTIEVALGGGVADGVAALAARYGVGPATVVHAAWHAVLAAAGGERTSSAVLVSGERRHEDLEGAVGAFAAPVPTHAEIAAATTFAELVQEIDHAAGQAAVWQDYAPAGATGSIGVLEADAPAQRAGELSVALRSLALAGTG